MAQQKVRRIVFEQVIGRERFIVRHSDESLPETKREEEKVDGVPEARRRFNEILDEFAERDKARIATIQTLENIIKNKGLPQSVLKAAEDELAALKPAPTEETETGPGWV